MITVRRLAALARQENWRGLLAAAIGNGPPLSRRLRSELEEPSRLRGAALALATKRAAELSFRLDHDLRALVERLLAMQDPRGGFGDPAVDRIAMGALEHAAALERRGAGAGLARAPRAAVGVDTADGPVSEAAERLGRWLEETRPALPPHVARVAGRWSPSSGSSDAERRRWRRG